MEEIGHIFIIIQTKAAPSMKVSESKKEGNMYRIGSISCAVSPAHKSLDLGSTVPFECFSSQA